MLCKGQGNLGVYIWFLANACSTFYVPFVTPLSTYVIL